MANMKKSTLILIPSIIILFIASHFVTEIYKWVRVPIIKHSIESNGYNTEKNADKSFLLFMDDFSADEILEYCKQREDYGFLIVAVAKNHKNILKPIEFSLERNILTQKEKSTLLICKYMLDNSLIIHGNVNRSVSKIIRAIDNISFLVSELQLTPEQSLKLYSMTTDELKSKSIEYSLSQNFTLATACNYLLATSRQYPAGMFELAKSYFEGNGVKVNIEQGLKWLELAAKLHYSEAEFYLGNIYVLGVYVSEDIPKGVKLIEKAANGNNIDAILTLGSLYAAGNYIGKKDIAKAIALYDDVIKQLEFSTDRERLLQTKVGLAKILWMDGNLEKAAEITESVLKGKSDSIYAMSILSLIYTDRKKYSKSMELLKKAYDVSPNNYNVLYALGYYYYINKNKLEALLYLEAARKSTSEPIKIKEIEELSKKINNL